MKHVLLIWILLCAVAIGSLESDMWQRIQEGSTIGWAIHYTGQDQNDLTSYDSFKSVAYDPKDDGVWVSVERTEEDVNVYHAAVEEVLGDYPTLRAATDQADPNLTQGTAISSLADLQAIHNPHKISSIVSDGAGGFVVTTATNHGFSVTGLDDLHLHNTSNSYYTYGPYTIGTIDSPTQFTCSQAASIFNVYRGDETNGVTTQGNSFAGNYYLTQDIDASGTAAGDYLDGNGWLSIGQCNANSLGFVGTLDGNGYTISGLYQATDRPRRNEYSGLFWLIGENATIANLNVTDVNMFCTGGGVLAMLCDGTVYNCATSGTLKKYGEQQSGLNDMGGFIGRLGNTAVIYDSNSSVTVDAKNYHSITENIEAVGGFVGGSENAGSFSEIHNCYATGNVVAEGQGVYYVRRVGGFIGLPEDIKIYDSYATGNVEGDFSVGGFMGTSGGSVQIYRCYATGDALAHDYYSGGFAGSNNVGYIYDCYAWGDAESEDGTWGYSGGFVGNGRNCVRCYSIGTATGVNYTGGFSGDGTPQYYAYWDTDTSGTGISSGGTGRSTTSMKTRPDYHSSWDFDTVWYMDYTAPVDAYYTLEDVNIVTVEKFTPLDWYTDINDAWFVDSAGDERYVWHDSVDGVEEYGDYTKYYITGYKNPTVGYQIYKCTTNETIDTTWGTDGHWTDGDTYVVRGVVVLDDGSFIACLDDAVVKIDVNGVTDTSWGTSGYYTISTNDMSTGPKTVLEDNDGNFHIFGGNANILNYTNRHTYGGYIKLDSDGNFVSKLITADSGAWHYNRAVWADDEKTRIIAIHSGSPNDQFGGETCSMVAIDPATGDVDSDWTGNVGVGGHAAFYEVSSIYLYHIVRASDGGFICHQANAVSHFKILSDGSAYDTDWATSGKLTTGQTAYDSGDAVYMDIDSNDNVYSIVEISNEDWLYKIDSTGTVSATHNTTKDGYYSLAVINDIIHLIGSNVTTNEVELWSTSLVFQSGFDFTGSFDAGRSIIPDEYTRESTIIDACDAYWETVDVNYSRLEGRYLCVFADGNSIGTYLVTDGELVGIDANDYDYFLAGLNYYSIYESFPLVASEITRNQRTSVQRVGIDFYETMGANLGVDMSNSSEIDIEGVFDGYKIMEFPRGTFREPVIYLWEWEPLSMTIRGVYLREEISLE